MKTNIINIHGMSVVKTGRILVYEEPWPEEYSFSEEIIDVITGVRYGFNGITHLIGKPVDAFVERKQDKKRGKHSCSRNKRRWRANHPRWMCDSDELPF